MRVGVLAWLFPSPRFPFNGIYVREELDRLADHADIRVIAPQPIQYWRGDPYTETTVKGYPVIRPFTVAFPSWFFQRLFAECMAMTLSLHMRFFSECDLVHVHNTYPEAVAAVKTFGRRHPIVVTVHGTDVNVCALNPALRPAIVRALNSSDRVICVSGALAATLRDIGVSTEMEVIPNGIDTERFCPGDRRKSCAALGLDPDRPRILFAGNFVPVKGIEYLIRAAPEILAASPECEIVLLGAPAECAIARKYYELARNLGVQDVITVRGKVPNAILPSWMRAADLFVLPSLKEGFGIVLAEALACGIPVVSTRSGGPEDIVEKELGILIPPGDSEALADAVIRGLAREGIESPEFLADSMRRRFSHTFVTRKILDVYGKVLAEWGKRKA